MSKIKNAIGDMAGIEDGDFEALADAIRTTYYKSVGKNLTYEKKLEIIGCNAKRILGIEGDYYDNLYHGQAGIYHKLST